MEFASPKILWFLLLLAPLTAYYIYRTRQGGAAVTVSTTASVKRAPKGWRYYLRHVPFILRTAALTLIIIALARPQSVEHNSKTNSEGIDIVLAVDASTSMLARDFNPDRLSVAKEVGAEFIADRTGDRIGIVVFAGESYTQSPLTTDQSSLQTMIGRIRSGIIEDGTAIGNGLATSINRLRESDAKSKIVILLTDGVNNRGEISPLTAAQIAKEMGIKVYTIGISNQCPWGLLRPPHHAHGSRWRSLLGQDGPSRPGGNQQHRLARCSPRACRPKSPPLPRLPTGLLDP